MEKSLNRALDIMKEANRRAIVLSLEEGRLRLRVPPGQPVDQHFIGEIKEYKEEISNLLQAVNPPEMIDWSVFIRQRMELQHLPLSFNQESLWFIDGLEGSLHYHIPLVYRLKGRLSPSALLLAFRYLIGRHAVLRTVIREQHGSPWQEIREAGEWNLTIMDGHLFRGDADSWQEQVTALTSQPFQLDADMPIRAQLAVLSPDEHLLILTLHHIAADGWSHGILLKELRESYMAFSVGCEPQLPALPVQYADYALRQRTHLSGPRLEGMLDYWRRQLSGLHDTEIPSDHGLRGLPPERSGIRDGHSDGGGRRDGHSTGGGSVYVTSSPALWAALQGLAGQMGVTPFMLLLTVFKILVYRYTGSTDICVGTPVAGRHYRETEGLIGFFVNTLALRSDVSGNPPFRQLLAAVKETTLTAYEHQEVPFEKVVEAVAPVRTPGKHPLFQLLFAWQQREAAADSHWGDIRFLPEASGGYQAPFDLSLAIMDGPEQMGCHLLYNTRRYEESTIRRMLDHYMQLLSSVVRDPDQRISRLSMLTSAEEQLLLGKFAGEPLAAPIRKTAVDLLAEQVERTPQAIALEEAVLQVSYRELDHRSNQLAHYLRRLGVGKETLAGICMDRSIELIIAILGIWKAGGAYVPLDPAYPPSRIGYMLEDTEVRWVLSDEKNRHRIPSSAAVSLVLPEVEKERIAMEAISCPAGRPLPEQLAYVMYTSGSTGRPKGVMIEHRSISSLTEGRFVSQTADGVLLATCSPSFDVSTFEYWETLLHGGKLVLYDQERLLDVPSLRAILFEKKITRVWFTAGWLNHLLDMNPDLFEGLTTVIAGGEKLSAGHMALLRARYPAMEIINGYGPTENTTFSLTYPIGSAPGEGDIPIGRPLDGRLVYILDQEQNPVAIGVPGEIYVGGAGLARGYWRRPELTREKFVRITTGNGPPRDLYRTGDLGKWLPDGTVAYLGRLDEQVKIRGYRIEPGEIEQAILESGLVRQAAVAPFRDKSGEQRLAGFLVVDHSRMQVLPAEDLTALLSFLRNFLPEHMIPVAWVRLDSLPLTVNGKVDKKALPYPGESVMGNRTYTGPRDDTESAVASIWQEVLGIPLIDIHDNFFAIGGHSLLVGRVVHRLRGLHYRVHFKDLFVHQTIAALAAFLAAATDEAGGPISKSTHPYICLLNEGDGGWPVFLLPGSPGICEPYEEFAAAFHSSCRIYGLPLPADVPTLSEMASRLETWIREIQPRGPYRLIGHSLGAYLAFEIARQWEARGESVGLVVLLDAVAFKPSLSQLPAGEYTSGLIGLARHFLERSGHILHPPVPWFDALEKLPVETQPLLLINKIRENLLPGEKTEWLLQTLHAVINQAMIRYRPEGKLRAEALVVSSAVTPQEEDGFLGWRPYLEKARAFRSPGDHESMVKDVHAVELAEKLKLFLKPTL